MYFTKNENKEMIVTCYAVELYLPAEYATSKYRETPFYSVLGSKIRTLGVGNFRLYRNEDEMKNPEKVKCHPFGVPMLITMEPQEIDVYPVRFSPNGPERNCIVLTFMKGDRFISNTETIKNSDAVMQQLARLEQGKMDNFAPEVAVSILDDNERMNGLDLRIPSEEKEIFVAERYRDPDYPQRKYRFHTGKTDPDAMVSHSMRVDSHQSTTFQAIMHEDPNTALLASVLRDDAGVRDEPSAFEALVRGMDMEPYARQDFDPTAANLGPLDTE